MTPDIDPLLLQVGAAIHAQADELGNMTAGEIRGQAAAMMRRGADAADDDELVAHTGDDVHRIVSETLNHLRRVGFCHLDPATPTTTRSTND